MVRAHLLVTRARVLRDGCVFDAAVWAADDALAFASSLHETRPDAAPEHVPLRLFHLTCAYVCNPAFDEQYPGVMRWNGRPVDAYTHLKQSLPDDRDEWTNEQRERVLLKYSDMAIYNKDNADVQACLRQHATDWDFDVPPSKLPRNRRLRRAIFRGEDSRLVNDGSADAGYDRVDDSSDDGDHNREDVFVSVELIERAFVMLPP